MIQSQDGIIYGLSDLGKLLSLDWRGSGEDTGVTLVKAADR